MYALKGLGPALLVALATAGAEPAAAQSEAEILLAAMQDGGKVIYLRHAATNQNQVDTGRLGDRAGQRNLSAAGIAQAKALMCVRVDQDVPPDVLERLLSIPNVISAKVAQFT